jgi:hypothetical protein
MEAKQAMQKLKTVNHRNRLTNKRGKIGEQKYLIQTNDTDFCDCRYFNSLFYG